jgi:Na+(H+)/acetate symporter ActP
VPRAVSAMLPAVRIGDRHTSRPDVEHRSITDTIIQSEQLCVARAATVVMGLAAIILGIILEGQNVAFMVGLAFAIAASANFPALLMAIFWRRFTTWGGGH